MSLTTFIVTIFNWAAIGCTFIHDKKVVKDGKDDSDMDTDDTILESPLSPDGSDDVSKVDDKKPEKKYTFSANTVSRNQVVVLSVLHFIQHLRPFG